MEHPEYCWSHDLSNNCTVIKWGESGYYKTDYPKGKYNDEVIDELNEKSGITKAERRAMEQCSLVAQYNPNLNWDEFFADFKKRWKKHHLAETAHETV